MVNSERKMMTLQIFHVFNLILVECKFKEAMVIFNVLAKEGVNYSGQTTKKACKPAVIWSI